MSLSIRKFPAMTRPGKGSRPLKAGSCSCGGGLMDDGKAARLYRRPCALNRRAAAAVRTVTSIAETDAEIARGLNGVRVERHGLHDRDRLLHEHRDHVRRLVGDDVTELALLHHADSGGAEPERQKAIAVGGAAPTLEVSEHQGAALEAGAFAQDVADLFGQTSQPN